MSRFAEAGHVSAAIGLAVTKAEEEIATSPEAGSLRSLLRRTRLCGRRSLRRRGSRRSWVHS
jgi:hypothetical protein